MTLGLITPEDVPFKVSRILRSTNRDIIRYLCNDIILNSHGKGYIAFSPKVFDAYKAMKEFNYKQIYECDLIKKQKEKFSLMVKSLFNLYLEDIHGNRTESNIFKHFIVHHRGEYWETEKPERIVADYIAGMTDQYFLKQYELRFIPQRIDYNAIETISQFRLKQ